MRGKRDDGDNDKQINYFTFTIDSTFSFVDLSLNHLVCCRREKFEAKFIAFKLFRWRSKIYQLWIAWNSIKRATIEQKKRNEMSDSEQIVNAHVHFHSMRKQTFLTDHLIWPINNISNDEMFTCFTGQNFVCLAQAENEGEKEIFFFQYKTRRKEDEKIN